MGKTDRKNQTLISVVAIVVLGALEALALIKGVDGAIFGIVIAAISGLGGYEIGSRKAARG
jgi:hypothetical protein